MVTALARAGRITTKDPAQKIARQRLRVLQLAEELGSIATACRRSQSPCTRHSTARSCTTTPNARITGIAISAGARSTPSSSISQPLDRKPGSTNCVWKQEYSSGRPAPFGTHSLPTPLVLSPNAGLRPATLWRAANGGAAPDGRVAGVTARSWRPNVTREGVRCSSSGRTYEPQGLIEIATSICGNGVVDTVSGFLNYNYDADGNVTQKYGIASNPHNQQCHASTTGTPRAGWRRPDPLRGE